MISNKDREYLEDNDYSVALGRVFENDGYDSGHFNITADRIYPFSNENISQSISEFDLNGKSVITVGSSGDQVLNCILKGATDIILIDGNPLARYYLELKLSAIKNLNYEECLKFLTEHNVLNYKYYQKVSHDLSIEAKLFWDHVILEVSPLSKDDLMHKLFHNSALFTQSKMSNAYFQSRINYEKLKTNFYNSGL